MPDRSEILSKIGAQDGYFLKTPNQFESFENLIGWIDENRNAFSNPNALIGLENPSTTELMDLLFSPWESLNLAASRLRESAENKAENQIVAGIENINSTLIGISNGESFSLGSGLHTLLNSGRMNNFTRWGMLHATFEPEIEPPGKSPLSTIGHVNERSEFNFGALLGTIYSKQNQLYNEIEIDSFKSRVTEIERDARTHSAKLLDFEEEIRSSFTGWTNDKNDLDKRLKDYIEKKIAQYVALTNSHKAEMERIRTTYTELLSLKDAAAHWNSRADNNRNIAYASIVLFFVVATGALFAIFEFGPTVFENFLKTSKTYSIEPSPLLFLAFASVPSAIFLWAVRFPSKLFTEHLKISNDARFRHTLVTTYLSLLRDESNPVNVEERHFALRSIFSQAEAGGPEDQLNINLHDLISQKAMRN